MPIFMEARPAAAWGPRPSRSLWLESRQAVSSECFRRDAENGGRDARAPKALNFTDDGTTTE